MLQNNRSTFQYHVKDIHNYIVKPFRVIIIQYTERICEIYDMDNYLPHTSKKWDM